MLNGRVYGGRRASEATLAENAIKKQREKNEPEFVEWGNGKGGGGIGSNQPARGFLDDEDDGSGMAWARKRRQRREQEEREKKEREAREREQEGGDTSALELDEGGESDQSRSSKAMPITPAAPSSQLPPPPIIQVSEHLTPYDSAPAQIQSAPSDHGHGGNKPTNPIGIMASQRRQERDVFDESGDEDAIKRGSDPSDSEEDDEEEEEEEEDEEDGDFSDDDEEEEEFR